MGWLARRKKRELNRLRRSVGSHKKASDENAPLRPNKISAGLLGSTSQEGFKIRRGRRGQASHRGNHVARLTLSRITTTRRSAS